MSHPRHCVAALGVALLFTGGCEQFRSLKPSNSDERSRPEEPEDDGRYDDGRYDDGYPDIQRDASVPPVSYRDAGSGGTYVPPPPFMCTSPSLMCGGSCVNVTASTSHCGGCDHTCPSEQSCKEGQCACWTRQGQIVCNGTCMYPLLGVCGTCGEAEGCASEPVCDDGESHVADWPAAAGDLGGSGYNAGERGAPPLSKGWAVSVAPTALNPVVVVGSRVFASARAWYQMTNALVSMEVSSGQQIWKKDFGLVTSVAAPAAAGCRLYIEHGQGLGVTPLVARLWSLAASSGEVIWAKAPASASSGYDPPLVTSSTVYAGMSSYDGLFAVARSNAAKVFDPNKLASTARGSAAFHDGELYTFANGQLQRRDANTGAVLDSIRVNSSASASARPVLTSDGTAYVVGPPMVYAFEAKTKRLLFQVGTKVSLAPAVAEGLLLIVDDGVLTARDVKTGAFVWSASGTKNLSQSPVAAHGFAYVASETESYAVDLTTGAVVWQESGGGPLAIGAGHLFVAGTEGILRSYLLTQPSAQ